MKDVTVGFLVGLKTLNPNSPLRRRFIVDVPLFVLESNKTYWIILLEYVSECITILLIMILFLADNFRSTSSV